MTNGLLTGKTGFVTGAASGIGCGIAKVLAAEGANVVLSDLSSSTEEGAHAVAEIKGAGGVARFIAADVTSGADVETLIAQTCAINGRIDFAVNNAGIGLKSMLADSSEDLWDRMNDVNLKSCFRIMRAVLPIMRRQKGGSIVNISSIAGAVGLREAGIYSATKHAMLGLTRTAAGENGDVNVRINAILPNAIRSRLLDGTSPEFLEALLAPQAIKRLGEPEECGHLTAFLLSERAAFITGACIPIDGGYLAN
ncbi:SDR family oxidoreductase [Sphingomonadales bacterium 56]|uniref:SDR family NAD(P)-dependent oxidoreductase n=1 Tax=unclassified Sphingobium TaxID=2611147 RepID=UPI00191B1667|nr:MULTISPECIES: SDR family NAD(P)-dependent oxidoreductase [unclassified Sphingobium]MBY2929785.1 SDR family oxidoreductase [Sphingomonadales bacterium 56]MBY2960032.1 SDR family oxidoreductase [Sphingomonadales bacterium 58]CAD7340129.1 Cyclopentanol dehydrogenase [Sphingobium sp. S6]CAD7340295.1 Cyclopentanol dehydrogenase [Sphingobium sp. S8]